MGKSQVPRDNLEIEFFLESTGIAVFAIDSNGTLLFMNKVAESLTGWKADEALGRTYSDVVPLIDEKEGVSIEMPMERMREEETIGGTSFCGVFIEKTGLKIPVQGYAASCKDEKGNCSGGVLFVQKGPSVKAPWYSRNEVMRTLSHELRTPLTVMKYALHNIKNDPAGNLSDKQSRNFDIAYKNCERMIKFFDSSSNN